MILEDLFRQYTGSDPVRIDKLTGSGSSRVYCRLFSADGSSVIGTIGTNIVENEAFLYLDSHFLDKGLPVPKVLTVSTDRSAYLQEDLGDTSLYSMLDSAGSEQLLKKTLRLLPRLQFEGAKGLDFTRCYPVEAFDDRSVMWDLNYFKYCFLKVAGIEFDEALLEDDFERLTKELLSSAGTYGFMYRDFQSRNVMIRDGEPYFIDFQGGRRGPALYDLASFLWQARAGFNDEQRYRLAREYFNAAGAFADFGTESDFIQQLRFMALFRTIQVLGAYGFRGIIEQKPQFVVTIPKAIGNLTGLMGCLPAGRFPELQAVLTKVTGLDIGQRQSNEGRLTVEVNSFGFRKSGIPRDYTGNGGGFVFDCRAITNPGRYQEYVSMTGLDTPVINFLEENGEITQFLEHAKALIGASVEKYIKRGFSNLKVSFGCTGGQHRSVYSAQHVAEWLNETYGVAVELHHIEQNIHQKFQAR